jgi:hypothetical protein
MSELVASLIVVSGLQQDQSVWPTVKYIHHTAFGEGVAAEGAKRHEVKCTIFLRYIKQIYDSVPHVFQQY